MKKIILMLSAMASIFCCLNLTACGSDDDDDEQESAATTNGKNDGTEVATLIANVLSDDDTVDLSSADSSTMAKISDFVEAYENSTDNDYKTAFINTIAEKTGMDASTVETIIESGIFSASDSEEDAASKTSATEDGKTLAESYATVVSAYSAAKGDYAALATNTEAIAAINQVMAISKKYQNSDDEVYKETLVSEIKELTGDNSDNFLYILQQGDTSGNFVTFVTSCADHFVVSE